MDTSISHICRRLWLGLILLNIVFPGYSQKASFEIEQFIEYLNSRDIHTQMAGFLYLNQNIKDKDKANIFEEVWGRVEDESFSETVYMSIATYFLSYQQMDEIWTQVMIDKLVSLSKYKNPTVRQVCLNTLSKRVDIPKVRPVLLKFLEDEDPFIRELALTHIFRWKDAKPLLTDFVDAYRGKENFSQSVAKAAFLLERLK